MWQGKDRASDNVLFLVLGLHCIECGVLGKGAWLDGSVLEVAVAPLASEASESTQQLVAAIHQLTDKIKEWQSTHTAQESRRLHQISVVIADTWVAEEMVPWHPDIRRNGADAPFVKTYLRATGYEHVADGIVRLSDAPYGEPRLALVYPASVQLALDAFASVLGGRVTSAVTVGGAARLFLKSKKLLNSSVQAVVDDDQLVVSRGEQYLTDLTVRQTQSEVANSERSAAAFKQLRMELSRMKLRDSYQTEIGEIPVLNLVSGDAAPTHGNERVLAPAGMRDSKGKPVSPKLGLASAVVTMRSELDLIQRNGNVSQWGVLAIAVMAVLLGALLFRTWQIGEQVQAVNAEQQRNASTASRLSFRPGLTKEEVLRVQAINGAVRELNLPFDALLAALRPPSDIRASVLRVEMSGAASGASKAEDLSKVRIVAEALTGAEMAKYVAFVGSRSPFVRAYLTQHEIIDTDPARPYRFAMEASWQDR